MKNLRNKLFAAVAMLLISGVMLTSASFAWFTISTSPEVSNIKTEIQSNYNLEIALNSTGSAPSASAVGDSGNNNTWGNLVNLPASSFSTSGMLPAVSTGTGSLNTVSFGLDGRTSGSGIAATASGSGVVTLKDASGEVVGYKIELWLRSNVDNTVTLSTSGTRATGNSDISGNAGLGSIFVPSASGARAPTIELYDGTTKYTVSESGNVYTMSGSGISLNADTAKMISVLIYYPAATLTNADLDVSSSGTINLQFVGSVSGNAYNYHASGSGR